MSGRDDTGAGSSLNRRKFVSALLAASASACTGPTAVGSSESARLSARPGTPSRGVASGLHALDLDWIRDGFRYVPRSYDPAVPAPLLVLLHGGGRESSDWSHEGALALYDEFGLVIVAPDSRGSTWDVVEGRGFVRDVGFIDRALRDAFDRCNIDRTRVALGGFSDGASYALSLGLPNGDLFESLVAFSPGMVRAEGLRGKPRVYVTHGTADTVLPAQATREVIVPGLKSIGLDVTYVETTLNHAINQPVVRAALQWLTGGVGQP